MKRHSAATERFLIVTVKMTEIAATKELDLIDRVWQEAKEAQKQCAKLRKEMITHLRTNHAS